MNAKFLHVDDEVSDQTARMQSDDAFFFLFFFFFFFFFFFSRCGLYDKADA